jgi:hypothetical protein
MTKRNVLLVALVAGCSFPAFADKAYIDSAGYADLAPQTDLNTYSGAKGTWKGTLTRAEVVAAMRGALAAGTVPVGDAIDYPLTAGKTTGPAGAGDAAPDTSVLGAAPRDGLTIDGYRFVGGEAGYVRAPQPLRR